MVISEIIKNPELLRNNNNKELIIDLVSKKGSMLQYASNELKNDIEVVSIAINNDYTALQYASEELKNNFKLVIKALDKNGLAYEFVGSKLKKDYDIMLYAVCKNGKNIKLIEEKYRTNEIIFASVFENHSNINLIDEIVDKQLALLLASLTQSVISHLSYELLFDEEFMLELVQVNPQLLKRIKNEKIVLFILNKHHEYAKYIPDRFLKTDAVNSIIKILSSELLEENSKLKKENEELKNQNEILIEENNRLSDMIEMDKMRQSKIVKLDKIRKMKF